MPETRQAARKKKNLAAKMDEELTSGAEPAEQNMGNSCEMDDPCLNKDLPAPENEQQDGTGAKPQNSEGLARQEKDPSPDKDLSGMDKSENGQDSQDGTGNQNLNTGKKTKELDKEYNDGDANISNNNKEHLPVAENHILLYFNPVSAAVIVVVGVLCFMIGCKVCCGYWCGSCEGKYTIQSTQLPQDTLDTAETRDNFQMLNGKIEELKNKFPNQTERHWKTIRSQFKKLFKPERQTKPAIILFSAEPHAVHAMNCIAKEIGVAFAKLRDSVPVLVWGEKLANIEDSDESFQLDKQVQDAYKNGQRIVIMFELESFHQESLLLLHNYCDHETANFKDVVIMFTLRLEKSKSVDDVDDQYIDDYLGEMWEPIVGVDEMGALLSRLANNKAISMAETDEVLKTHCS